MKEEVKNSMVEKLNNGLLDTVKEVISDQLGVETSLEVECAYYQFGECFLYLVERGNETSKQLTATPLLSHLFLMASLFISVEYDEKTDMATFSVSIKYDHNDGGSNSHGLMRFAVDLKDNLLNIL
jgi:hypothetical protein